MNAVATKTGTTPPGATETAPRVDPLPQEEMQTARRDFENLPVGPVLRQLRGSQLLRDVQKATGISTQYISSIENGTNRPGMRALQRLVRHYDTTITGMLQRAERLRDNPEELEDPTSHGDVPPSPEDEPVETATPTTPDSPSGPSSVS